MVDAGNVKMHELYFSPSTVSTARKCSKILVQVFKIGVFLGQK